MVDVSRARFRSHPSGSHRRRAAVAILVVVTTAWLGATDAPADDLRARTDGELVTGGGTWRRLTPAAGSPMGTLSCASATCHGSAHPKPVPSPITGDEYLTWLEHDPHSRATRTLDSPEFQRILVAVSRDTRDAPATVEVYRRCAACHDPEGLAHDAGKNAVRDAGRVGNAPMPEASTNRGIGCESCHGEANSWLAKHYERGVTRGELTKLGLRNLNDLVLRGRVCAGCHVGDEDRDMNHDMIAAGHPPLRFELAAYHDLIARKHWRESDAARRGDFTLNLWAAGQVAVADGTLGLTASRARRASRIIANDATEPSEPADAASNRLVAKAPWPEFAEYDCFACHQRLRPVVVSDAARTDRNSGAKRNAGTPDWQTWNLGGTGPNPLWLAGPSGESAEQSLAGPWIAARDKLRGSMSDLLGADPARIEALALDARASLRRKFNGIVAADESVLNATSTSAAGATLTANATAISSSTPNVSSDVWRLVNRQNADRQSWSDACHEWLLLRAAYRAIGDRRDDASRGERVDQVSRRADEIERRFEEIARSLSFGSTAVEWPAYDGTGLPATLARPAPHRDLTTIAAALRLLAADLVVLRKQIAVTDHAKTH